MSPSTLPATGHSDGSTDSEKIQNGINEMKQKLKLQAGLQSSSDASVPTQASGADHLAKLFSNSAVLKIWKTAVDHLQREVRIEDENASKNDRVC